MINMKLESNLKLSLGSLNYKFISIMDNYKEELGKLIEEAVSEFDFEKAIKLHVKSKIEEGLEKAFNEIDLSQTLKVKLWNEIEERLND